MDHKFTEGMDIDDVLGALDQLGSEGKEWLRELETSRNPWFNVNVGDGFYNYHRSWNDDLSMPFARVPGYIDKVKRGVKLERPTAQLIEERQALVADLSRAARHRRGPRDLRPADHAGAPRLPLCRGA